MYVKPPHCPCDCENSPDFPVLASRPLFIQDRVRPDPRGLKFPHRSWDPDFYGLAVFSQFAEKRWSEAIAIEDPPSNESAETREELAQLLHLAETVRPERLPEIIRQDTGFPDYFLRLLMISPESHPETFKLMKVAARCAEMLMAWAKLKFSRPRPQQLLPALMPPISAQNHPAYPSGHAMMSRLMAFCLADAAPDFRPALMELSDEIGHNREIAGAHYHSDTLAGQSIAEQAHDKVLVNCSLYADLVQRARREWDDHRDADAETRTD
jgi:acid phosphatase (class A)